MPDSSEGGRPQRPGRPERPDYKVYRSRPGLLSRLAPNRQRVSPKRPKRGLEPSAGARRAGRGKAPREAGKPPGGRERRWPSPEQAPPWRRALKWATIAALVWLLISGVAFAVSSQLQKAKLADGVDDALGFGNPLMAAFPQTILVLGTDVRSGAFASDEEAASVRCIEDATAGEQPSSRCDYRSDTIMLVRAGGGAFRKLSIPRDTLVNIPENGPSKINAAYAMGGAELTVRTVEEFLGIEIDHVAIVDFDGFRQFIDTIGGVEVDLPTAVCSSVSGGAFNLNLKKGKHTLNGFQAITLARTRSNTCGEGDFTGTDLERTQFQQLILEGIKGRLTDPLRLPYNFIKGPIIGWNAPKAMVGDMGALTMPQLLFAAAIGGGGTDVLKPSALGDPLIVSPDECRRAVRKLLGDDPPREPACSPA